MGDGSFLTPPAVKHRFLDQDPLFDLLLHGGHSLSLRVLKPVGGAPEVAQDVMALVVQEDVLHL